MADPDIDALLAKMEALERRMDGLSKTPAPAINKDQSPQASPTLKQPLKVQTPAAIEPPAAPVPAKVQPTPAQVMAPPVIAPAAIEPPVVVKVIPQPVAQPAPIPITPPKMAATPIAPPISPIIINTSQQIDALDKRNRPQVRALQENLKKLNLHQGKVDGGYGPKTQASIDVFQEQYAQDIKQIRVQQAEAKKQHDAQRTQRIDTAMRQFNTLSAPQKKEVEKDLRDAGYDVGPVDGIIDNRTYRAVGQFLSEHHPDKYQRVIDATKSLAGQDLTEMSVEDTTKLQQNLHILGFDAGRMDGSVSQNTEMGVKAFRNLYLDPPAPIAKQANNNDVIQRGLSRLNLYDGNADGDLGQGSVEAIRKFVEKHPKYQLEAPTYDTAKRQPIGITSRHAAAIAKESGILARGTESVQEFGIDTSRPDLSKLATQFTIKGGRGYYSFNPQAVGFWKDFVAKNATGVVPLSPPLSVDHVDWASGYGGDSAAMGKLSGQFQHRNHGSSVHEGADLIQAPGESWPHATGAAPGIVLFSKPRNGYGNLVVIGHADGRMTAYAHGGEPLVKEGDLVRRDQAVFKMSGSGGFMDHQHLHFEYIDRDGKKIPPRFAGHDFLLTTNNYYSGRNADGVAFNRAGADLDKQKSLAITGRETFGPFDHLEDATRKIGRDLKGVIDNVNEGLSNIFTDILPSATPKRANPENTAPTPQKR